MVGRRAVGVIETGPDHRGVGRGDGRDRAFRGKGNPIVTLGPAENIKEIG